jgi:hypothetical protein
MRQQNSPREIAILKNRTVVVMASRPQQTEGAGPYLAVRFPTLMLNYYVGHDNTQIWEFH